MPQHIDVSLIDWSRAQFALTAIFHWFFVPLTLGLSVVAGVMETAYYRTGSEFWKLAAKFWMKIFGIHFAVGMASGLILEFEFGTNWSNYAWFAGDVFGAPLAIEGLLAFFMEAVFVSVMFFGWDRVGKGFHLASTWLVALGAVLSAWWILVANAWMQYPAGTEFNPDTMRGEMFDFWAVAFSPVAINKFFHTVLSGWILGAIFVVGVSCWFLLKRREKEFAVASIKIGAVFGLISSVLVAVTGDGSGHHVARVQPMKLAAFEGYYEGHRSAGLVAFGILDPDKKSYDDGKEPFLFRIEIPGLLSFLSQRDVNAFVPGIKDIIEGGYPASDGSPALSAREKIERGQAALTALATYRSAKKAGNTAEAEVARNVLRQNKAWFGYGYIKDPHELVPNVALCFYAFRVMVMLGGYFIAFFMLMLFLVYKKDLSHIRWVQRVGVATIPLGYVAGQAGWITSECGRQPWAVQDMLPVSAAVSMQDTGSVQITFFVLLAVFIMLFIAGASITVKAIGKGVRQ